MLIASDYPPPGLGIGGGSGLTVNNNRVVEDERGAVAIEMAVAFIILVIVLLGLTEVCIATVQQKQADHAFDVFSELVMSQRDPINCQDLDNYYQMSLSTFLAGNIGSNLYSKAKNSDSFNSQVFGIRVAGVAFERVNGNRVQETTLWQSHYNTSHAFSVGNSDLIPKNLESEGEFYVVVEGETRLRPMFSFIFGNKGDLIVHNVQPIISVPRYQPTITMSGSQTGTCSHL